MDAGPKVDLNEQIRYNYRISMKINQIELWCYIRGNWNPLTDRRLTER